MSFLATYAGPQRKMISNLSTPNTSVPSTSHDVVENEETQDNLENEENTEFPMDNVESHPQIDSTERQDVTSTAKPSIERKKNKKPSAAEVVAGPMVDYLKTVTAQAQSQGSEPDDPTLTFFKSLVPDVNKLDARTQRNFKVKVMELLNSLLDKHEESQKSNHNSSRPFSSYSASNCTTSDYSDHSASYDTRTISTGPPSSEQGQEQENDQMMSYGTYSHSGHFFPYEMRHIKSSYLYFFKFKYSVEKNFNKNK